MDTAGKLLQKKMSVVTVCYCNVTVVKNS